MQCSEFCSVPMHALKWYVLPSKIIECTVFPMGSLCDRLTIKWHEPDHGKDAQFVIFLKRDHLQKN